MPNWCSNRAQITGPTEIIEQVLDHFTQGRLLEYLHPEPDYAVTPVADVFPQLAGLHITDPDEAAKAIVEAATPRIRTDGRASWDWRVQNWGTKWDIREGGVEQEDHHGDGTSTVTLDFNSAWSPPTGAYKEGEKHLGLSIEACYLEEGVGFYGFYENGEDTCEDLPCTYEERRELPDVIQALAGDFEWMLDDDE